MCNLPVCGELTILAEDRATVQTCEAAGGGESSPLNEVAVHTDRAPVGHSRAARPSRRGSGGRG